MKRKFVRSHVMAIGLAVALGMLLVLSLLVGLGGLHPGDALAVSGTLPTASNARALAATGSITGLVQAEDSGAPLEGAVVEIYDGVSFALLYTTTTDADGHYSATVTSPYSQARLFFDGEAVGYSKEWHKGNPFFSQADRVNLQEAGVITDVNAILTKLGAISGTVTLSGGVPATNISVVVYDTYQTSVDSGLTDGQGQFIVTDLMKGAYRLQFTGDAFPEWYQDKDSFAAADAVTVTAGKTTTITAQVILHNVITGLVTEEGSGAPISNTKVVLYDSTGSKVRDMRTPCQSCGSGEFRFYELTPGNYRLQFDHSPYHFTEFYSNQQTLTNAITVSVAYEQRVTNINAALVVVPTGTLALTLTQNNQPLSLTHSAYVKLYDPPSGRDLTILGSINGDGSTTVYTFAIPVGNYQIYLGANYPLIGEWYNDRDWQTTADIVTITVGAQTTISANLTAITTTAPGCITGTVTSGGAPLQGAEVRTYEAGHVVEFAGSAQTDSSGAYGPICMRPGDYQVSFSYFPSMTTWYSGSLSRAAAAILAVTSNVVLSEINGALDDLGGCISGRMVDVDQRATEGRFIVQGASGDSVPFWYGLDGSFLINYWYADNIDIDTDKNGGLVACGLATGDYTLRCWTRDWQGSVSVSVTAPLETGGVICKPYTIYLPVIMRDFSPTS